MDEFKSELKALLKKYNASIEWDANGDLNGLNDEFISFYVGDEVALKVEGCNVSIDDIN